MDFLRCLTSDSLTTMAIVMCLLLGDLSDELASRIPRAASCLFAVACETYIGVLPLSSVSSTAIRSANPNVDIGSQVLTLCMTGEYECNELRRCLPLFLPHTYVLLFVWWTD